MAGYLAGITAAGVFAPAAGAFVNELFPTPVRSSVAGWNVAASVLGAGVGLVAFGAVADVGNRFGPAALATFLPAMCLSRTDLPPARDARARTGMVLAAGRRPRPPDRSPGEDQL